MIRALTTRRLPIVRALMTVWCMVALAGCAVTSAQQSQSSSEVFTPEHIARIRSAGSARISPDGKHIAYTLSVPRRPYKDDDGGDGSGSAYVFVLGPESDLDGVIDECDNCPAAFNPEQDDCNDDGVGDACISAGDFNGDGVVDVIDFVDFLDCFGGIDAAPNPDEPACIDACLNAFDFDTDGDVDWMDAASFQIAVTP